VDQRNTEVVHSEHDSINTARAQRVQWCLLAMCGQQEQLMYDGETDEVYGGQLFKCCNTEYSFSMFDLLTARAFAFTQQHQHYSCSEYRLLSSDLHVSEQQFDVSF